jgi:hypothetical protein
LTKSPLQLAAVTAAGPMDLRDWITSRIPAGAVITSLRLFCTSDLPDRALCLISFRDAVAIEVANALHGQTFGFDSAVVSLAVGSRFTCRCRAKGTEMTTQCCCCTPGGAPPPSLLDQFD